MKLLKKLYNPFVLIGEGFVLGALIFFATHPETGDSVAAKFSGRPVAAAAQGSFI